MIFSHSASSFQFDRCFVNLYPSIKPPVITEPTRNVKIISIASYKTVLSYFHYCQWFVLLINSYFLTLSTLLTMPPSIRIYLNYGQMAALVAIDQDSHILTLTGLSLGIMRLVQISHTVLVPCLFDKKKSTHCIWLQKYKL